MRFLQSTTQAISLEKAIEVRIESLLCLHAIPRGRRGRREGLETDVTEMVRVEATGTHATARRSLESQRKTVS